jgi:hypothetical protein
LIKNADEIKALEACGYRVVPLGKGEHDAARQFRVRKGSRGKWHVFDERGLLELIERERAALAGKARRRGAQI